MKTYFSTFSGIGGFELGIQQAYEETKNSWVQGNRQKDIRISGGQKTEYGTGNDNPQTERQDGRAFNGTYPECVGYSEIDKYAIQVYEKHFPAHKNFGDITKIEPATLPDFDMLCGGFPCQSFSIAGKRGGFDDTRGTLFFDIARIVKVKRPAILFLENVKGLLSHDGGRTFDTIIRTIDELGYDVQWQVCNSKNFGVAQNRERVFIVGHTRGTSRPKVFPFLEIHKDGAQGNQEEHRGQIGATLSGRSAGGQNARGNYVLEQIRGGAMGERVYDSKGIATSIRANGGGQRRQKRNVRGAHTE